MILVTENVLRCIKTNLKMASLEVWDRSRVYKEYRSQYIRLDDKEKIDIHKILDKRS